MPSFPRRRESRSVGTETYRENGFLRFYVLDSHFRGNDGIKVSKFILNN
ncbi:pilus assembly protein PilS [Neisseria meningitidis]|nr:pilus assembly protein PilS [Neisseria meningitidis]